jgi:uncharacterized membrane protein YidH (DUF202 family)
MADFNLAFLVLFVLIFGALGVSNFVEANSKGQQKPYQRYMGLLYLVLAVALVLFKVAAR